MKKTLRLVAVFALMGATLAYTGCTDYSKDFDDINNRIEALESGKLKSVEEQVAGLKSTVASLEEAKAKAEAAIDELKKNSATAADLKELEAKLDAAVKDAASKAVVEDLKSKIEKIEADLAKYAKVETLNAEVEKLNKAIADAKALSEKEFATVNDKIKAITDWQVEAIAKLGALEGQIKTLEEGLATSQQDIITLTEGLKSASAAVGILEGKVEEIYLGLNTAQDDIRNLTLGLKATTAGLAIAEQDIIALQTEVTALKKAIEAIKEAAKNNVTAAEVETAVKEAIEKALKNEGNISVEIAKAVEEATAKLQKEIDFVKSFAQNLSERVQSIVYVPETWGARMTAIGYALGNPDDENTVKTDILVKATYEISPANLVDVLDESSFFFSTVAVKAEPAEYFAAEILSKDASTGRIVVLAHIPDGSAAYKNLNNTDAVALALNVADPKVAATVIDGDDTWMDAGSYVSSSYTIAEPRWYYDAQIDDYRLNFVNIYNQLCFCSIVETEDGTQERQKAYSPNKDLFVEYNDVANSTRKLFAHALVCLDINDNLYSLEEASEFLGEGFEFELSSNVSFVYSSSLKPFTVVKNGFESTAKIKPIKNCEGQDMIDKYVRATLTATVNSFPVSGNATALYKITREGGFITIANSSRTWNYSDGLNAQTGSDWAKLEELRVSGVDDFYSLDIVDNWTVIKSVEGETPVEYKNITKSTSMKIDVQPESKNLAKIQYSLPYTKGKPTNYQVTGLGRSKDGKYEYTISFQINLGAMPEDKTIDLGTITKTGSFTKAMKENIDPIEATFLKDASYYAGLDFDTFAKDLKAASSSAVTVTYVNGVKKSSANSSIDIDYNETSKAEISTLEVNNEDITNYTDKVLLLKEVSVYGVKYTYRAIVQLEKPAYKLVVNPTYVDGNNVVTLDGKVSFNTTTGVSTNYTLNAVNLGAYFEIEGLDANEDLAISYTLLTKLTDENRANYGNKLPVADVDFYAAQNVSDNGLISNIMKWNTEGRELKMKASLYSAEYPDNTFGEATITIIAKDVISKFDAPTAIEASVINGESETVELVKALQVVDLRGNSIVNPDSKGKTYDNIWDLWTAKGAKYSNFYKKYEQSLEFYNPESMDWGKIKAYQTLSGGEPREISLTSLNYDYQPSKGTLKFIENSGNIQGTITFEIPVRLYYFLDWGHQQPKETVVKVNFTQGQ